MTILDLEDEDQSKASFIEEQGLAIQRMREQLKKQVLKLYEFREQLDTLLTETEDLVDTVMGDVNCNNGEYPIFDPVSKLNDVFSEMALMDQAEPLEAKVEDAGGNYLRISFECPHCHVPLKDHSCIVEGTKGTYYHRCNKCEKIFKSPNHAGLVNKQVLKNLDTDEDYTVARLVKDLGGKES